MILKKIPIFKLQNYFKNCIADMFTRVTRTLITNSIISY